MDTLMLELSKPFAAKFITWKPGATTKDKAKAMAMPYADTRAYQKRLDDVCGFNWSVEYQPWGDTRIVCNLTINGVTRSSTGEGEPNDGNCGTSAEAQAFKRACSAFGLGRFLYEMPAVWVPLNGKYISDEETSGLRKRYQTWAERKLAALTASVNDEDVS